MLVACHLTINFQPEDDWCHTYWNIAEQCLICYIKDANIPYSPIHNKDFEECPLSSSIPSFIFQIFLVHFVVAVVDLEKFCV